MLNALTTLACGSFAWSSSAIDVGVPSGDGVGRFATSTTTLPATSWPISVATLSSAVAGTARTTRSAARTASAFELTARAPVRVAASVACSGCSAETVTSWPARVNDDASARPTLPAPMMAICMARSSGIWLDMFGVVKRYLLTAQGYGASSPLSTGV